MIDRLPVIKITNRVSNGRSVMHRFEIDGVTLPVRDVKIEGSVRTLTTVTVTLVGIVTVENDPEIVADAPATP